MLIKVCYMFRLTAWVLVVHSSWKWKTGIYLPSAQESTRDIKMCILESAICCFFLATHFRYIFLMPPLYIFSASLCHATFHIYNVIMKINCHALTFRKKTAEGYKKYTLLWIYGRIMEQVTKARWNVTLTKKSNRDLCRLCALTSVPNIPPCPRSLRSHTLFRLSHVFDKAEKQDRKVKYSGSPHK